MSDSNSQTNSSSSFHTLFRRYRRWLCGTWILVLGEAILLLLFPLFIGLAVDDLLNQQLFGILLLGGVATATVVVGSVRRFYDTRTYSWIYSEAMDEVVARESENGSAVSAITARTGMASELVEFLENSLPEIINSIIGMLGTLLLVYWLQLESFYGCLIATLMIAIIYASTSTRTFTLNKGANDEAEKRVDILTRNSTVEIRQHFRSVAQWNIRLSDLETVTFAASWIILIGLLLYSIWATVQSGVTSHGKILSVLMYVFGYIESVIVMPLFYQQLVRLREISARLE